MKTILTALALATTLFAATGAHAQRAALVQDAQRPTALSIVTAHCAVGGAATCAVYTVPAGKILHLTQIASLVKDANGALLQWKLAGFTSLYRILASSYDVRYETVDLYLPAGFTIVLQVNGVTPAFIDASLFGTLSDQ